MTNALHTSLRHGGARRRAPLILLVALAALFPALAPAQSPRRRGEDVSKLNRFVQGADTPAMRTLREGRDLIDDEQWAKAAAKFNSFLTSYPGDRDTDAALYWLAYSLKQQGQYREAARHLARLIKDHTHSSWAEEATAMLTEIAPQIGDREAINRALGKEDEELKMVALQSLFEADEERAMAFVAELLRPGANASPRLKEAAVSLLGSHGGKKALPVLLDIARNQSDPKLRTAAIRRLGDEGGEAALDDLARLYDAERDTRIKEQILRAISEISGGRAAAKLQAIARNGGEQMELRRSAIRRLGEREEAVAFDTLSGLYAGEQNAQLRAQILHAFSEMNDPRARAKLLEIARGDASPDLRRQAVHWLGERGGAAVVDELMRLYAAEREPEIRRQILRAFSEIKDPRAEARLVEAARSEQNEELRRYAIRRLGERDTPQSLELLIGLYDAEKSLQVKQSLLHAFSESKQKRALQKLMQVARTDSSLELRKSAVHWIGQSRDPEALKFLEQILKP